MKRLLIYVFSLCCTIVYGAEYVGRVVDAKGVGIGFATVYVRDNPSFGTATNTDGFFSMNIPVAGQSMAVVSFLGYEKRELPLSFFQDSTSVVVLKEQPIALEETVISAKPQKQKNKRKQMSELLYKVYNQMEYDFSDENARYKIVSDVRMDAEDQPWGMETLIATSVVMPKKAHDGNDSVQFSGEVCKRYFTQTIRSRADSILDKNDLDKRMRHAANEVDSGIVVHKTLWQLGNIRYDFAQTMKDVRNWEVTHENEGETVLTHTEKHNYMGMLKITYLRHYIVDSDTYRVRKFSEEAQVQASIPFGYKLKGTNLDLLNLLNMDEKRIEKFRLRKGRGTIKMNTLYKEIDGHLYPSERNLWADVKVIGTKDMEIPLRVRATQRATKIETTNVKPMKQGEMNRRVRRQIVEIY